MLLDNTYGLPNLFEFNSNHFNSLIQDEFKNNSNGGKYIDVKISCQFWNWIAFSYYTIFPCLSHCLTVKVSLPVCVELTWSITAPASLFFAADSTHRAHRPNLPIVYLLPRFWIEKNCIRFVVKSLMVQLFYIIIFQDLFELEFISPPF